MKRFALLLYVVLCAVVVASPVSAAEPPHASDLEAELVCPICGTTLDQSDSPVALRMKAFIRARIAAGDSAGQIKAKLVDQFGPGVIASPPKGGFGLLGWLLPIAVAVTAAVVIGLLVRRWSRRSAPPPVADRPLDPSLERRIDEELARFEG